MNKVQVFIVLFGPMYEKQTNHYRNDLLRDFKETSQS